MANGRSKFDAEITDLLRRDALIRAVDSTACTFALSDLGQWPGVRFSTNPFLTRVWTLRDTVRTWDAFYVALAEVLHCPLVTLDAQLTRATGPDVNSAKLTSPTCVELGQVIQEPDSGPPEDELSHDVGQTS